MAINNEVKEELLEAVYYDNCPGCEVDRGKRIQTGLPIKELVFIWVVILCVGASEDMEQEELKRKRTDNMQIPYDYKKLNESYETREIALSDDYFPSYTSEELAATSEKPVFTKPYIPNSILKMKIYNLEKDLENERKRFEEERAQFLNEIKMFKEIFESKTTSADTTPCYSEIHSSNTSSVNRFCTHTDSCFSVADSDSKDMTKKHSVTEKSKPKYHSSNVSFSGVDNQTAKCFTQIWKAKKSSKSSAVSDSSSYSVKPLFTSTQTSKTKQKAQFNFKQHYDYSSFTDSDSSVLTNDSLQKTKQSWVAKKHIADKAATIKSFCDQSATKTSKFVWEEKKKKTTATEKSFISSSKVKTDKLFCADKKYHSFQNDNKNKSFSKLKQNGDLVLKTDVKYPFVVYSIKHLIRLSKEKICSSSHIKQEFIVKHGIPQWHSGPMNKKVHNPEIVESMNKWMPKTATNPSGPKQKWVPKFFNPFCS